MISSVLCVLLMFGCSNKDCLEITQEVARVVQITPGLDDDDLLNLLIIVGIESAYKHEQESPVGAYGLFQLMPITEQHMNEVFKPPKRLDRYDLKDNIFMGVNYYAWLKSIFIDIDVILVGYNWGPRNATRYALEPNSWLPDETRNYLDKHKRIRNQCRNVQ